MKYTTTGMQADMRNFELSNYELELNWIFTFKKLNYKTFWTSKLVRTWTKSHILLQINVFFTTCTDSSERAT